MPPRPALRRFLVAVIASVALVLAAPFVGVVRSQIRTAFPEQFSFIINGIVGISVLAAVAAGLARVRERRLLRYGAMAAAILIAAMYSMLTGSPDPTVSSVEHFHFVEYGTITFLFYLVWRDRGDWGALTTPFVAAFVVGIAEEWFQWFLPARIGELKDVWLNSVAVGCGLLFSLGAAPPAAFSPRWTRPAVRLTCRAAAVGIVALAAFLHAVHLGVDINDPGTGSFASRYSARELAGLGRVRAAEWRDAPPLVRPDRFSREDQYMTEGLQHIQARNKAWESGDLASAWHENLILERHFAVVLDTPSYVSKTGHRWSPEHRADAEVRVGRDASQPFVSRAYPYPIFVWSPVWLWLVALGFAVALWRDPGVRS